MIDDKGNRVPKLSIVRDTNSEKESYWFVVDENNCREVLFPHRVKTFEQLKENGYIKHSKQLLRLLRATK